MHTFESRNYVHNAHIDFLIGILKKGGDSENDLR